MHYVITEPENLSLLLDNRMPIIDKAYNISQTYFCLKKDGIIDPECNACDINNPNNTDCKYFKNEIVPLI